MHIRIVHRSRGLFAFQLARDDGSMALTGTPQRDVDTCMQAIRELITSLREHVGAVHNARGGHNRFSIRGERGTILAESAPRPDPADAEALLSEIQHWATQETHFHVRFPPEQQLAATDIGVAVRYDLDQPSASGRSGVELLRRTRDDLHSAHLNDADGRPLLYLRGFPGPHLRDEQVRALLEAIPAARRYRRQDSNGRLYFVVAARNGRELARSRWFASAEERDAAIAWLIRCAPELAAEASPPARPPGPGGYHLLDRPPGALTPGFAAFRHSDRRHYFHLHGPDGVPLLFSHGYGSARELDAGIRALIRVGLLRDHYRLRVDQPPFHFVIHAGNGRQLARSREFTSRSELDAAIAWLLHELFALGALAGVRRRETVHFALPREDGETTSPVANPEPVATWRTLADRPQPAAPTPTAAPEPPAAPPRTGTIPTRVDALLADLRIDRSPPPIAAPTPAAPVQTTPSTVESTELASPVLAVAPTPAAPPAPSEPHAPVAPTPAAPPAPREPRAAVAPTPAAPPAPSEPRAAVAPTPAALPAPSEPRAAVAPTPAAPPAPPQHPSTAAAPTPAAPPTSAALPRIEHPAPPHLVLAPRHNDAPKPATPRAPVVASAPHYPRPAPIAHPAPQPLPRPAPPPAPLKAPPGGETPPAAAPLSRAVPTLVIAPTVDPRPAPRAPESSHSARAAQSPGSLPPAQPSPQSPAFILPAQPRPDSPPARAAQSPAIIRPAQPRPDSPPARAAQSPAIVLPAQPRPDPPPAQSPLLVPPAPGRESSHFPSLGPARETLPLTTATPGAARRSGPLPTRVPTTTPGDPPPAPSPAAAPPALADLIPTANILPPAPPPPTATHPPPRVHSQQRQQLALLGLAALLLLTVIALLLTSPRSPAPVGDWENDPPATSRATPPATVPATVDPPLAPGVALVCPDEATADPAIGVLVTPFHPLADHPVRLLAATLADESPLTIQLLDADRRPRADLATTIQPGVPSAALATATLPAGDYTLAVGRGARGLRCHNFTVAATARQAATAGPSTWPIERAWSPAEEALHSAWLRTLFAGDDRGPRSFAHLELATDDPQQNLLHDALGLREDSGPGPALRPDAALLPYTLRAYWAWKRRLPFAFRSCSADPARCEPARSNLDRDRDAPPSGLARAQRFFQRTLPRSVQPANLRTAPDDSASDFYPVALTRPALRPGTIFTDPYGHVLVLVEQRPATDEHPGRLLAVEAHADGRITGHHFWPGSFLWRPDPAHGGSAFKHFRPALARDGKVVQADNSALPDLWTDPASLTAPALHARVDALVTPGPRDPFLIQRDMIDALAEAVRARIVAVERGASQLRTQRGALPMPADFELFAPHGAFNSLATTARDLRLHAAIAAVAGFADLVRSDPAAYGTPAGARGEPILAQLISERERLLAAPRDQFSYRRSDGSAHPLTLAELMARAPALEVAYNPNDCPEQRWGAPAGSDEASTCTRRAPPDQQQQMASHRAWFRNPAPP